MRNRASLFITSTVSKLIDKLPSTSDVRVTTCRDASLPLSGKGGGVEYINGVGTLRYDSLVW
jgi:hypothetical protein